MRHRIWNNIRQHGTLWRRALPGLFVIGLIIVARLTGSLQFLEWIALDYFLRLRPAEPPDDRIVIVAIDAADLQQIGTYPIPDRVIIDLIKTLQTCKPAAIGLNILSSSSTASGNANLFEALGKPKNLIAAETVLWEQTPPLSGFPPEQVGFTDIYLDGDNSLRRMVLGARNPIDPKEYKFSLALRLAETYLAPRGYTLENGMRDYEAMRFGSTEYPRFLSSSGGYVRADAAGVQILLNFRSGQAPFRILSLNQIRSGNFDPAWLRDRIILIGITDPRIRPPIPTNAIASSIGLSGKVHGIEIQAHTTSQLISAVLDGRPSLNTWSNGWEYLWILSWGLVGISLIQRDRSAAQKLLEIIVASIILTGLSYWFLIEGLWIPLVPAVLVLLLAGIGYAAFHAAYEYERSQKAEIDQRQHTINARTRTVEQAVSVIHSGPLQTLATLQRWVQDDALTQKQLLKNLENLDTEIRGIGEYLRQEALMQENSLYLGSGQKLDLKSPLHDLFYEVYFYTLERNLPGFSTLKVKVRSFEPVDEQNLTLEQKRRLCQFLEETLCNVGKHAEAPTHLKVTGIFQKDWYILRTEDNGLGICSLVEGEGTRQALKLKTDLKGKFSRKSISPQGTQCELTWRVKKSKFWGL